MKNNNEVLYYNIQQERIKMLMQLKQALQQKEKEIQDNPNSVFAYIKGFVKSLKNIYLLTQKDMLSMIPQEARDIIKQAQKDVIKYTLLIEEMKKNTKNEEDLKRIEELMKQRDEVINTAYNKCQLYLTPVQQRYYYNNKRDIHQEFFSFDYKRDKHFVKSLKSKLSNDKNNKKKTHIMINISVDNALITNVNRVLKHNLTHNKTNKGNRFYR